MWVSYTPNHLLWWPYLTTLCRLWYRPWSNGLVCNIAGKEESVESLSYPLSSEIGSYSVVIWTYFIEWACSFISKCPSCWPWKEVLLKVAMGKDQDNTVNCWSSFRFNHLLKCKLFTAHTFYISLEENKTEAGIRKWRATKSLLVYFTTTISNNTFLLLMK